MKRPANIGRVRAEEPGAELGDSGRFSGDSGRISAVLDAMVKSERNEKGQFTRGMLKTLKHSLQLRAELGPLKDELAARVRTQLALDADDGRETLVGVVDMYVEARLLRSSAFVRMAQLGGFMTSKGKARALLSTWATAFDREMRAAEKLGLEKQSRHVESVRQFLDREAREREQQQHHEDDEQHE